MMVIIADIHIILGIGIHDLSVHFTAWHMALHALYLCSYLDQLVIQLDVY